MFALVDCNSFYCSCEAGFQPRLWGRPVVVLSNNDGCVIARSVEAKAAGISMGTPAFLWREEFKKHRIEVFSSNYELYGDMSGRVMQVLRAAAMALEIHSIDEAFLRLDGTQTALLERGREIRALVRRWTGLPVGVGVASTKVLAKLANRHAKKNGGVYAFDHTNEVGTALRVRSSESNSASSWSGWRWSCPALMPRARGSSGGSKEHLLVAILRAAGGEAGKVAGGTGDTDDRSGPETPRSRSGGVSNRGVSADQPSQERRAAVQSAGGAVTGGSVELHPGPNWRMSPGDPVREEKERRLMAAVDQLNAWGRRGTVRSASLGAGRKQEWQMRRD